MSLLPQGVGPEFPDLPISAAEARGHCEGVQQEGPSTLPELKVEKPESADSVPKSDTSLRQAKLSVRNACDKS